MFVVLLLVLVQSMTGDLVPFIHTNVPPVLQYVHEVANNLPPSLVFASRCVCV